VNGLDNDFQHHLQVSKPYHPRPQLLHHSNMAPSRAKTSVILVGGGGTIGSSTALHLLRSGYTPSNITVLDTYPIPSAQSAGNDLNKIMGIRLQNKVDLQLSLEARQMWKEDELFKEYFHNTGRVSLTYLETQG
jgi:sarcosine oxidase/L-pipecolate oxidase